MRVANLQSKLSKQHSSCEQRVQVDGGAGKQSEMMFDVRCDNLFISFLLMLRKGFDHEFRIASSHLRLPVAGSVSDAEGK